MGGLRACPEKERVYACLLAPALPLQALARSEPDLAGQPVAVAEGAGTSARILHVSRAARALGASPGMTPSQARSVAPEVRVRLVAPGVLEAAAQALVDAAFRFSPSVQALAPGVVVLDVRGTERLYPSRPGLGAAMQAAAERAGLKVRAGIAAGHRLAVLAARSGPGVTWIPRGRESELLGPLPVAVLGPSPPLRDTLARLGLDTVGALARLDGRGLGIRLGPEALDLYRLAKGDDPGSLTPIRPADVFEETVALDYVLDRAEPVLFRVSAALQRLAARLDDRHLAPSELRLGLDLEPEGVHGIRIRLPAPTPDLRSLLALVRIHLESHPPTAPVRGFSLQADGGLPVPSQGHLFGPPVPEPSRLAALMARLSALAGPENVGSPRATTRGMPSM
jgi:protein ImuB